MEMRVWWIPQIPGKPFHVEISTVDEGMKLLLVLAEYDLFQYENKIKPDYANAGGIEYREEIGGDWWSLDEDDEDEVAELKRKRGEA